MILGVDREFEGEKKICLDMRKEVHCLIFILFVCLFAILKKQEIMWERVIVLRSSQT